MRKLIKIEDTKVDTIKATLWASLMDQRQIEPSKIYKQLKDKGKNRSNVKEAIKSLQKLSMVNYEETDNTECSYLERKQILGRNIESLPCLGCQSLGKCGVGENYSPENCKKLSFWINKLRDDCTNE